MADKHIYVDPGNAGGTENGESFATAYGTLNAAETAEDGNITGVGDYYFHCKSSDASADEARTIFDGWTTDATHRIIAQGGYAAGETTGTTSDPPSNTPQLTGVWSTDFYHINYAAPGNYYNAINVSERYVELNQIQIDTAAGEYTFISGISVSNLAVETSDLQIINCILAGTVTTGAFSYGLIYVGDGDLQNIDIIGCVISGGLGAAGYGIWFRFAAEAEWTRSVVNSIVSNCINGVAQGLVGTVAVTNSALFNNVDDLGGTMTISYCATAQGAGEGVNGVDISGTWDSTCFTDANGLGPDWSIQDTDSPLYLASELTQFDDPKIPATGISGNPRNTGEGEQTSIGAFELVAAEEGISITWFKRHHNALWAIFKEEECL